LQSGLHTWRTLVQEGGVKLLRQDDFLRSLLVLECWRQGKDFGSSQVPLMILGCLANRIRLGWGTAFEVMKNIPKFSALLEQPNRDLFPDIWEPGFIRLLQSCAGILDGTAPDPSCGGVFWADLRKVTNPWFKAKVLNDPLRSPCANLNSFTVFR
jgi:hypothetical protein